MSDAAGGLTDEQPAAETAEAKPPAAEGSSFGKSFSAAKPRYVD